MSTGELIDWADRTGSEMLWYLQEYKKHGSIDSVLEVKHAVIQLHAVVDEIYVDCVARSVIV